MFLGYNTNGFAHHRLEDAIEIIAELGYGGVALTPDVHHFDIGELADPYDAVNGLRLMFEERGIVASVIETGARFVLDPWRKHQPTLISATEHDQSRRV